MQHEVAGLMEHVKLRAQPCKALEVHMWKLSKELTVHQSLRSARSPKTPYPKARCWEWPVGPSLLRSDVSSLPSWHCYYVVVLWRGLVSRLQELIYTGNGFAMRESRTRKTLQRSDEKRKREEGGRRAVKNVPAAASLTWNSKVGQGSRPLLQSVH